MIESTTATVKTLTAEVRVLMVGNRQITLSVVKQLDLVDLDQVAPLGRVRMTDGEQFVVGADKDSGVMIKSSISRDWKVRKVSSDGEFDRLRADGWQLCPGNSQYLRYPIDRDLKAAALELPLIVLAGLR